MRSSSQPEPGVTAGRGDRHGHGDSELDIGLGPAAEARTRRPSSFTELPGSLPVALAAAAVPHNFESLETTFTVAAARRASAGLSGSRRPLAARAAGGDHWHDHMMARNPACPGGLRWQPASGPPAGSDRTRDRLRLGPAGPRRTGDAARAWAQCGRGGRAMTA